VGHRLLETGPASDPRGSSNFAAIDQASVG
jgi:hypothetical protein